MSLKGCFLRICLLSLILCLLGPNFSLSAADRYDLLIKGTRIVDGTGKPAFKGDIAIKGEKIVAVGKVKGDAATVIDGSGLVACPGFVDSHSHAEMTIEKYPLAENFIMQGITTVLGGNCGLGPFAEKRFNFGEWLAKVEKSPISINLASLVPHSIIRALAMGGDWRRKATPAEIEKMKVYVDEAMRSGAFGLSAGTDPPWPGLFADIGELIELAKVVQKFGGIYSPHTRGTRSEWFTDDPEKVSYALYLGPPENVWVGRYRGYLEAIEVCRKAKIPLLIAHFSNAFKVPQPHPDYLEEAAARASVEEIIDKARAEGLNVTFNIITCSSSISGQTPLIEAFFNPSTPSLDWVKEFKKGEFIERLKTKEFRDRLRRVDDSCNLKFGMVHTKEDPYWMDCFKILTCKNKSYEGKTIGEIALLKNVDALEAIFEILVEDPETTWIQFLDRRGTEAAIPVMLKSPVAMPCTDVASSPAKPDAPGQPPIAYGIFADYFGTYVREKGSLSLEEAVKKATSLPAQTIGLKDRGILSPGAYADITIIDIGKIRMTGDFLNPSRPPDGVEYVLVNGKVVYKEKTHTGEKPGKVLRHSQ